MLPKKIKLLPYDSFEIETTMSVDEIVAVLNSHINPEKFFAFLSDKEFTGNVSTQGFEIRPIIRFNRNVRPILKGVYLPDKSGIKILIKIRFPYLFASWIFIWFGIIIALSKTFNNFIFFGILFLFIYFMTMLGFKSEADKASNILLQLFQKH